MYNQEQLANLKAKLSIDTPISIILGVCLLALYTGIFYLGVANNIGIYLLGVLIAVPLLVFTVLNPKFWIYTIAISSSVFFQSSDSGVSVLDVVVALFYIGGLFLWFFQYVFIRKVRIIRNSADWVIIAFFVLLLGNVVVAYTNDVDLTVWFREYILFFITLMFFPIRHHFTEMNDIKRLTFVFSLSVIGVCLGQFYLYYKMITSDVIYAYQLGNSVRQNQTLFTAVSIFGLVFSFQKTKLLTKLYTIAFTTLAISSLVITFSRTFWLILILGTLVIIYYLPMTKKIILISTFSIGSFIVIGTVYLVFEENATVFYQIIEKRFMSSSKGTKDISAQARFAEWTAVGNKILANPIGGNGLAKGFHYYDPILELTKRTDIIHNGYINMSYRMGIPLALMYFYFIIFYAFKSVLLLKKIKSGYFKQLALIGMLFFFTLILANFTSSQFVYRDGIFTVIFAVALVSWVEEYYIKTKTKQLT